MNKGMTSNEWKLWTKENDGLTAKDLVTLFIGECITKSIQPIHKNFAEWSQKKFLIHPPPQLTRKMFIFHIRIWARDSNRNSDEKAWYAKNTRGGEPARAWENWIRAHNGVTAVKLVQNFMVQCYKNERTPTQEHFQLWLNEQFLDEKPPEMLRMTFNKNKILWGADPNRTTLEKEWYSRSIRGGQQAKKWKEWTEKHGPWTAKDLVSEFLKYCKTCNGQSDLEYFNKWVNEKFPGDQPPEINRVHFNSIKSLWGQDGIRTAEEREWYLTNRNSGPTIDWINWSKRHNDTTAQDLINDYLDQCFKYKMLPSQEDYEHWVTQHFSENPPPQLTKVLFKAKKQAWGNNGERIPEEKAWYYNIMNNEWVEWSRTSGGLTAKDLVYEFMTHCFHDNQEPHIDVFNTWVRDRYADKAPAEIEEKTYSTYRTRWATEGERNMEECNWYATTVQTEWAEWSAKQDGWTAKKLVNSYMDECYSKDVPPDQDDFNSWCRAKYPQNPPPAIAEKTFLWHKGDWGRSAGRTEEEKDWYYKSLTDQWTDWSRKNKDITAKMLIENFMKECCASNKKPNFEVFCEWANAQFPENPLPRTAQKTYENTKADWVSEEGRTEKEIDWYFTIFQKDWGNWARKYDDVSLKDLVNEFTKESCSNGVRSMLDDFELWMLKKFSGDLPPQVPKKTFESYTERWGNSKDRSVQETKWYHDVQLKAYHELRASRIGEFFEDYNFSVFYKSFQERGIILYHETPNFGERGRLQWDTNKKSKHVEGRLFVQDLLRRDNLIGSNLRKFLLNCDRQEVVIDFTIGHKFKEKFRKYLDQATGVIVVILRDTKRQQSLDRHVVIVGIEEFASSNWLNLSARSIEQIHLGVQRVRDALRHGLDSPAYATLREEANRAWGEIAADVAARASRAQYEARVGQEIAGRLRRGEMPEQLTAYVEQTRAAGDADHADRLDLMARAMAALGAHLHRGDSSKGDDLARGNDAGKGDAGKDPGPHDHDGKLSSRDRAQGRHINAPMADTSTRDPRAGRAATDRTQEYCPRDAAWEQLQDLKRARKEMASGEKRAWRHLSRAQRELSQDDPSEIPDGHKYDGEKAADAKNLAQSMRGTSDLRGFDTIERLRQDRVEMDAAEGRARTELAIERACHEAQVAAQIRREAERAREREERAESQRARKQAERAEQARRQDASRECAPERHYRSDGDWEGPRGGEFRG